MSQPCAKTTAPIMGTGPNEDSSKRLAGSRLSIVTARHISCVTVVKFLGLHFWENAGNMHFKAGGHGEFTDTES